VDASHRFSSWRTASQLKSLECHGSLQPYGCSKKQDRLQPASIRLVRACVRRWKNVERRRCRGLLRNRSPWTGRRSAPAVLRIRVRQPGIIALGAIHGVSPMVDQGESFVMNSNKPIVSRCCRPVTRPRLVHGDARVHGRAMVRAGPVHSLSL